MQSALNTTLLKVLILALLYACKSPLGEVGDGDSGYCLESESVCGVIPIEPIETDSVAPELVAITKPNDGTYASNSALNFQLEFDEVVSVNGSFSIELDIGRYQKQAICTSSNSKIVSCTYTLRENITEPDFDLDGISFSKYNDDSGSIKDLAGNLADLTSPIAFPSLSQIKVEYTNFDNWLDASNTSTIFSDTNCSSPITDGALVSCWKDKKSGVFAKSSGGSRPTFNSNNAPNAKPSVYFNSDYVQYESAVEVDTSYTLFVVYDIVQFNTLNYFIGSTSGTTKGIGFGFGGSWSGDAGSGLYTITKATTSGTSSRTLSSTIEPMSWGSATYTPTKIFRDDTEALPYHSTQALDLPQQFLRIGGRDDGNSCCNNNGNIAELLIFSQNMTSEERQEVWCYLSVKYNFSYPSC